LTSRPGAGRLNIGAFGAPGDRIFKSPRLTSSFARMEWRGRLWGMNEPPQAVFVNDHVERLEAFVAKPHPHHLGIRRGG
jgi:hypothetical protein